MRPARALLEAIEKWPVTERESNAEWRREAAKLETAGRLSFADAWIAGLALLEDAEFVHMDPEFDGVPSLRVPRLPYTSKREGGPR